MNGHAALPSTRRTTISQRRGPSTAKKQVPPENGASNENISKPASSDQPYHERKVKKLRLSRALTIPEGTSVFDACRKMAARRADAMLLTDANGLLSGIVTDKDITTRVVAEELRPDQTPVSKIMTRNPIFVNSDSLAIDALQKMIQGKFRHLPVVENGEVIALLDITKCLYDAIEKMEKAAEQGSAIAAAVEGVEKQWGNNFTAPYAFIETIRERMFRPSLSTIVTGSSSVSLVSPSDPVYVAAKRMSETRSTSVIVSSQNKIQGILTSKDILMRVVAQNLSPELTLVEKVMTLSPECASLETPILDALHMMHDRKFLHLPVTDKGGSVVACLDVLQITNAAISLVENSGGTAADDMANTMMQKFWDSGLTLELPDDYEMRSESSAAFVTSEGTERSVYPPLALGNSFSFKFQDRKGRVHRFSSAVESLEELFAAIMQRLVTGGASDTPDRPLLLYEDDEGDRVLLQTNSDLVAAVDYSRSTGSKVLRLHLDYSSSTMNRVEQEEKEEEEEEIVVALGGSRMTQNVMDDESRWIFVGSGMVALCSIGLLVYLRRLNA